MFSDPGGKRSFMGRGVIVFLMGLMLGVLLGGLLPSRDALAQPGGSYQKTCKNCTDDGSVLRCDCSYKNKYSPMSIVYGMCESNSIWNDKSKLKCTPRGSFKRSCSNISWNENRLQAVCNSKKEGRHHSRQLPRLLGRHRELRWDPHLRLVPVDQSILLSFPIGRTKNPSRPARTAGVLRPETHSLRPDQGRRSNGGQATVHDEDATGDIARLRRGEERNHRRDLLEATQPPERNLPGQPLLPRG